MDIIMRRVSESAWPVFMAVPTIYVKLISALESVNDADWTSGTDGFSHMRLMISGSAALPASIHERWTELTGQKLLERYGMTEIGMALSNPYHGERRPGAVGGPRCTIIAWSVSTKRVSSSAWCARSSSQRQPLQ
jgi:malonyl-CoA/methylmalonyl-CoA synthetase